MIRKQNTLKELFFIGYVRVGNVSTNKNLTDPLMKGIGREKLYNPSNRLGLMPIDNWVAHDGNPTKNTRDLKN